MENKSIPAYLNEETHYLLDFLKYETKKSKSELIREACELLKKKYRKTISKRR